jgi:hypothetical protein
LDRSSNSLIDGRPAPPAREKPAPEESGFRKERELKDDGRYIIFYDFGDEAEADEAGEGGS